MRHFSASKCWIHCILLSGVLSILGCSDNTDNSAELVEAHLSRSAAYEKQGQYKAAIIEARNVIKKDPQNTQGPMLLARLLRDIGNAKSAIAVLEDISANSRDPQLFLLLTQCYIEAGKFHSAKASLADYTRTGGNPQSAQFRIAAARTEAGLGNFRQAYSALEDLAKNPSAAFEAKKVIASLKFRQKNYTDVEKIIQELLKTNPSDPEVLYIASQLAYLKNNLDLAETQLSDALIALPNSDFIKPIRAKILSQLSTVLTAQGRSSEALIYSRLLASENPELHEARVKLSDALAKLDEGDLDTAHTLLLELNTEYPAFEPGAVYLGLVSYKQGDFDKADQLFSSSIDPETATPGLVGTGALNKLQLNQVDESLAMLEQSLQSHPDNEGLLSLYGQVAIQQPGRQQAGAIALEKAIAVNPENFRNRILLANYYSATGKTELGIAQLEQVLKLASDNPAAVSSYVQFMLQRGDTQKAESAVNTLLAKRPDSAEALNIGARYAVLENDRDTAKSRFQTALSIDPDNFIAQSGLANLALSSGDHEQAIQRLERLVETHPDQTGTYKGLITAYELKQQPATGLNRVKELAQQHAAASAVLAEYYLRKQQFEKAAGYFDKAMDKTLTPNQTATLGATLYAEWAQQNLAENALDQARQHLLTASRYAPENPKIMGLLAEVEISAQRFSEAQLIIEALARAFPTSAQADLLTGKLQQVQGNQKAALDAYQKGWDKQPSELSGQLVYSALSQSGQTKAANEFLEQWLLEIPSSQAARITRATQLQVAGNVTEARVIFENLLEEAPDNLTVLNNLAWLYDGVDYQKARDLAAKAYRLAPDNPAVMDTYGWFLFKSGDTQKAVRILEAALAKMPANAEIRTHLQAAKAAL